MTHRTVALALGSGGARGYAHIGVSQVLAERGYEVVAVSGTSMGSVIGACVASGRLEEFEGWARGLRQRDIVKLLDRRVTSGGVLAGNRLLDELARLLGDTSIEDLSVPFTAVATDLTTAREVWFQQGSVLSALRASIAIPGVIAPAVIDGRLLADGGLLNPLPIDPLAAVAADITVAVSLQGARERPTLPEVGPLGGPRSSAMEERLRVSEVVSLSLDAMQQLITRYRLAGQSPDVLITVPVSAARTIDFHRASELIAPGRTLAAQALEAFDARGGG